MRNATYTTMQLSQAKYNKSTIFNKKATYKGTFKYHIMLREGVFV